jgi:hypothetical protein
VANVAADQLGRQYFRLFSAKTPLVSQLPGPPCSGHLSAYDVAPPLARGLRLANDLFQALLLAAAAFGIAGWRRRPDRWLLLITAFGAYQLALFALIHVKARFLLPMLPFLCGFAASFACARRERAAAEATIALTPVRLAVGAVLALLLLFLAFAGPLLDGLCTG